jgi:hypothetical protein
MGLVHAKISLSRNLSAIYFNISLFHLGNLLFHLGTDGEGAIPEASLLEPIATGGIELRKPRRRRLFIGLGIPPSSPRSLLKKPRRGSIKQNRKTHYGDAKSYLRSPFAFEIASLQHI